MGASSGPSRLFLIRQHNERGKKNIVEEIELHIEGMRADGMPIPRPSAKADLVRVAI